MFVLINSTTYAKFDISQHQIDSISRVMKEYKEMIDFYSARENADGRLVESFRVADILDIHPYYREAAIIGNWDLFNPPNDMAKRAYLDQKKGIGGGFWGAAFRTMFKAKRPMEDLDYHIPDRADKRIIIYQNPTKPNSGSAYFAQQFANYGAFILLLLGAGLVAFTVWIIQKTKKRAYSIQ